MKKVMGKFAKHGTGAIIGFLTGPKVAAIIASMGITFDPDKMEAGLIVVMTAAFGAIWNFVEHRIVKK